MSTWLCSACFERFESEEMPTSHTVTEMDRYTHKPVRTEQCYGDRNQPEGSKFWPIHGDEKAKAINL